MHIKFDVLHVDVGKICVKLIKKITIAVLVETNNQMFEIQTPKVLILT